jgi:hypothetical protein
MEAGPVLWNKAENIYEEGNETKNEMADTTYRW